MAFDHLGLKVKKNTDLILICEPEINLPLKSGNYKINISVRRGALLLDHIKGVTEFDIENDILLKGRFSKTDMPLIVSSTGKLVLIVWSKAININRNIELII